MSRTHTADWKGLLKKKAGENRTSEYEQHFSEHSLVPMLQRYASDSSQLNFLAGKAAERILELEDEVRQFIKEACDE